MTLILLSVLGYLSVYAIRSSGSTETRVVTSEQNDSMRCLSDRRWVSQTLMALVTPSQLDGMGALISSGGVGGIALASDFSAGQAKQLSALNSDLHVPLIIASDEEGGIVQRLTAAIYRLPSANSLAGMQLEEVEELFYDYGTQLKELGVDVAFGPVVDVGSGAGIGSRSISSDKQVVVDYASAVINGYKRAGVLPVLKHFPGHGTANVDSHISLPTTNSLESLIENELSVYQALLKPSVGVMVGHLSVPGLTESPTSLSPRAVGLLRGEVSNQPVGFDFGGLVFSDALNMGAITSNYSADEASLLALKAGVDVLVMGSPDELKPTISAILASIDSGELGWEEIDASVERILEYKNVAVYRCSSPSNQNKVEVFSEQ